MARVLTLAAVDGSWEQSHTTCGLAPCQTVGSDRGAKERIADLFT